MGTITKPLPAPDLPQMTQDSTISLNDLSIAGGVFVRIQQYVDAARGDYITVLWDSDPVKEVIVNEVSSDFPVIAVITDSLGVGTHHIKYTSQDAAGNTGTSTEVKVNIIDEEPTVIYPAPIFTDSVSDTINQSSITANAGTHVHIAPGTDITEDDVVTLFWEGSNVSGKIIDGGVESRVVRAADISVGLTFLIAESKLWPLKDKGTVMASYQVRRNGVVMGLSGSSTAMLDLSGGTDLRMMITTGAANTDYDAIHLYPFNQGVVKGPSGATIILSVVGDAVFDGSETGTYQTILNETGESDFKLRSAAQGNSEISAETMDNPAVCVQQLVRFGPYTRGNGNIQYLNYSTGAPANGLTPCSIYLKTTPSSDLRAEITMLRVSVNGSAVIDGYSGQSADILLKSDKSAEIDITNSVAETVIIEISLPESSGSINRLPLIFKSF